MIIYSLSNENLKKLNYLSNIQNLLKSHEK